MGDVVTANVRRAQEAARVIEEYSKVIDKPAMSEAAKGLRFSLYDIEKEAGEQDSDG